MKRNKLRNLFSLLLVFALLCSCGGNPAQSPSPSPSVVPLSPSPSAAVTPNAGGESPSPSKEPVGEPNMSDETIYIFMNNVLLGSYEGGLWYSRNNSYYSGSLNTRDYSLGELLEQEYRSYNQTSELSLPTSVRFGFDGLDAITDSYGDSLTLKMLAPRTDDSGLGVYSVPTYLPDDVYNAKYTIYNGYMYFGYENEEYILVTSSSHSPLPTGLYTQSDITAYDIKAVADILAESGIPGAPVNITTKVDFDLDGDGKNESLILAKTPWDDQNIILTRQEIVDNNSGAYAVAMILQDGKYIPLISKAVAYDINPEVAEEDIDDQYINTTAMHLYRPGLVFGIELAGVYDFNGDGIFEVIVQMPDYETGSFHAFTHDPELVYNPWTESMCFNYGM